MRNARGRVRPSAFAVFMFTGDARLLAWKHRVKRQNARK
jgi:hypothetical protein